jgi:hypothetical protein
MKLKLLKHTQYVKQQHIINTLSYLTLRLKILKQCQVSHVQVNIKFLDLDPLRHRLICHLIPIVKPYIKMNFNTHFHPL